MAADGGDAEHVLAEFARAGIEQAPIAAQLQRDGARSFTKSWNDLLACLESKSAALSQREAAGASSR